MYIYMYYCHTSYYLDNTKLIKKVNTFNFVLSK